MMTPVNKSLMCLFLSLIFLYSCSTDKESYIYDGAYNIKRTYLENENAVQYKYTVNVAYPSTIVNESLTKLAVSNNYKPCQKSTGWEKFIVRNSNNTFSAVYQYMEKYISAQDGQLLLISLRHQSSEQNNMNVSYDKVNKSIQEVLVVFYEIDNHKVERINAELCGD